MIQVYKLIKGFDIAAPDTVIMSLLLTKQQHDYTKKHRNYKVYTFFNIFTTGGHTFKLYKNAFSTNIGKFSFSNKILLLVTFNSFTLNKKKLFESIDEESLHS